VFGRGRLGGRSETGLCQVDPSRRSGRGSVRAARSRRPAGSRRCEGPMGMARLRRPVETIDPVPRPSLRGRRGCAGQEGGRPPLVETDPTLVTDLESLVDPVTRGDPESPLRWTCKSTDKLAAELRAMVHLRTQVDPILLEQGEDVLPDRLPALGGANFHRCMRLTGSVTLRRASGPSNVNSGCCLPVRSHMGPAPSQHEGTTGKGGVTRFSQRHGATPALARCAVPGRITRGKGDGVRRQT